MRKTLATLLAFAWAFTGISGWAAQKKSASKSATKSKTAVAKSTSSKTKSASSSKKSSGKAGASKTARKSSSSKSSSKKSSRTARVSAPRVTWRNRQTSPTAQRYQEIQQALAGKGFLNSESVNGSWGPDSVEALKKFQQAQNIPVTGKINSLSLIALGLGPKHSVLQQAKQPDPQSAQKPVEIPPMPETPESPENR